MSRIDTNNVHGRIEKPRNIIVNGGDNILINKILDTLKTKAGALHYFSESGAWGTAGWYLLADKNDLTSYIAGPYYFGEGLGYIETIKLGDGTTCAVTDRTATIPFYNDATWAADAEHKTLAASLGKSLKQAIVAEVARAQDAEAELQTNINTEAATRAAADTAEQTARIAADDTLQDNIDAEETARIAADAALEASKQDKLPTAVNDRYLHANSSTGALEWAEAGKVDDVKLNGSSVVTNKIANLYVDNNTSSTETTHALSANMGKELQDQINNLKAIGRFLSIWNCVTGLPTTEPTVSPYTYHTGDYYIVGTVAESSEQVNYKPDGSTYTTGVPSTVEETLEVAISDYYVFDGTLWRLVSNTQKTVTFANIAGNPYDNTNLSTALNDKVTKNNTIEGATHTKITYDSKGLVTSGSDLVENDIPSLHLTKITDVTATASEVNVLDGITATTQELNYVDGVTSAIQPQINSKQNKIIYSADTPSGQTLNDYWIEDITDYKGLTFTANTAGSTISITKTGSPTGFNFSYSTDNQTWNTFTPGTTIAITLTNIGDKVYFKGNNPSGLNSSWSDYSKFVITGSVAASGNIMSLIDNGVCTTITIPNSFCFCYLFNGCPITTTPSLPATTINEACYASMFNGCTLLTTQVPRLPATALQPRCYYGLFEGCTSLTAVPELPALSVPYRAYAYMFLGCTSLTTPPQLKCTSVDTNACWNMFYGCTALTTAPKLYSTRLNESCYCTMFYNCSSLKVSDTQTAEAPYAWTIPTNAICTSQGSYATDNMFSGCAGTRSTNSPNFANKQITYYTQNEPI